MKHRVLFSVFLLVASCCNRHAREGTPHSLQAASPGDRVEPNGDMAVPGAVQASPASGYVPPATTPGKDGWLMYVEAKTYTPDNVKDFRPGFATPEAALLHFFASKMRGDDDWKQAVMNKDIPGGEGVFTPEMYERLERKLVKSRGWIYFEISLVGKLESDGELYIKVREKIGFIGGIESGTDEATLMKVGDRWVVVAIPT